MGRWGGKKVLRKQNEKETGNEERQRYFALCVENVDVHEGFSTPGAYSSETVVRATERCKFMRPLEYLNSDHEHSNY